MPDYDRQNNFGVVLIFPGTIVNIIVYMYTYGGGSRARQLVGNEIGMYTGERTANFSSNERYFFSIQADGDWTITID